MSHIISQGSNISVASMIHSQSKSFFPLLLLVPSFLLLSIFACSFFHLSFFRFIILMHCLCIFPSLYYSPSPSLYLFWLILFLFRGLSVPIFSSTSSSLYPTLFHSLYLLYSFFIFPSIPIYLSLGLVSFFIFSRSSIYISFDLILYLSLSFYLSLGLILDLSFFHSSYLLVSFLIYLLSFYLSLISFLIYLSFIWSISWSNSLYLSLPIYLCLGLILYLSLFQFIYVLVSFLIYLSSNLSMSWSHSLSLSLPIYLSLGLILDLSFLPSLGWTLHCLQHSSSLLVSSERVGNLPDCDLKEFRKSPWERVLPFVSLSGLQ